MAGGAWKVAYADFVTAMMALFMVLWILGAEQEVLEQMQEYFRNPPTPWDREANKYMVDAGDFQGFEDDPNALEEFYNNDEPSILQGIMDNFQKLLQNPAMEKLPPLELSLTADELRMVMFDRDDMALFKGESTSLTDWGSFMVQNIAWLLEHYALEITIEAHSNADYVGNQRDYGPWELTTDRSNKIRRSLAYYAGGDITVKRVVGYGASRPLDGEETEFRKNQRTVISLSLPKIMESEDFETKRELEQKFEPDAGTRNLLELGIE